jgi:hypothetical protein
MTSREPIRGLVLAALVAVVLLGLGACEGANESRGRGDSPVARIDDTAKDVIHFPDRFSNVAHACDGHGHRVFVTTKSDASREMTVIADPSCNNPASTVPPESKGG